MNVYIQPRETDKTPVNVIGLEITPEDNKLAVQALKEAYGSAYDHKPDRLSPEGRARNQFIYGKEASDEMYDANEAAMTGYDQKMHVYSGVNLELLSRQEGTVTFYEHDSFPAGMVFSGIMFGIAQLNRQRIAAGEPMVHEPSITYIEGVPAPEAY